MKTIMILLCLAFGLNLNAQIEIDTQDYIRMLQRDQNFKQKESKKLDKAGFFGVIYEKSKLKFKDNALNIDNIDSLYIFKVSEYCDDCFEMNYKEFEFREGELFVQDTIWNDPVLQDSIININQKYIRVMSVLPKVKPLNQP